ncbi:sugar phosphate isomerase/epimerase family protein [Nodularia spumigena]|uniref:sugar phosphate isomerase/epimerase family protein n=1 Tax=Nodularia spumigena TaxID=70799 RepID=UPI00232D94B4|nr:TIM barrel protein [Nodularia spumigena]MDB9357948.1 TIM barrel protein [Nodularia spumigena CS-587/03]MDB9498617.1 TIM barrel protein [Nodularia spumigena CS-336/02]MDB9530362.1 TIM barrel protein [Nodularia spumigena CS-1038]
MIFISTGGIRHRSAATSARSFYDHGITAVELSGGVFSPTYETDLKSLAGDMVLQVHNYFPPPEKPFVFNLASADSEVSQRSVSHVRSAMRLALALNHPVYSFHAGFRISPKVSDLGQTLGKYSLLDRNKALVQFGEQVIQLAEEAKREGVLLLIENNVLTKTNLETYSEDPLLLTHPDEIAEFMEEMPSNVGFLLDVAHLKVSSTTLGFDLVKAHEKIKPWIRGYHLSDNDGNVDSNHPVTESSWFWPVLNPQLDYYTLEIYRSSIQQLVEQLSLVTQEINKLYASLDEGYSNEQDNAN